MISGIKVKFSHFCMLMYKYLQQKCKCVTLNNRKLTDLHVVVAFIPHWMWSVACMSWSP